MIIEIKAPFSTDIITNSSSVVYSMATSVDSLHSFIDEILKYFGTDKRSRDVFNIVIMPDLDKLAYIGDYFDQMDEDLVERIKPEYGDLFDAPYGKDIVKQIRDIGVRLVSQGIIPSDVFDNGYDYSDSSYIVSLKDGKETELGSLVQQLFSHEASYDG